MNLTTYEPWNLVSRFSDEINRLFQAHYPDGGRYAPAANVPAWVPAVDIKEEAERFLVAADLPGVAPEDIEITAEDGALLIKGERRHEHEAEDNGYRRTERRYGMFYRRFVLPESADTQRITATEKHGVLEIEIPKKKNAKARRIPVKA